MNGLLKRYRNLYPVTERTPGLSLGEGGTPLVYLSRLGDRLGVSLYAKYDGLNPTGSFKDRGMVLAVAKAVEEGATGIICASTGNTSASAAAYAARLGVPCHVLLPEGKVAMGKLAQAMVYGANVVAVRGNFDRALEMAREAAKRRGLAIVNSVNRYRLWGQRSGAWEVCDELECGPDWCVLPVGNAGNITAWWSGFVQYRGLGRTVGVPRMLGVQAEGASPLVTRKPCPEPETVATAIRIGNPVNGSRAKWAVRMTGGEFVSVPDEEILTAQKQLASLEGVFAEPASCAPLAGLLRIKKDGGLPEGLRVVMVLTGNGLKDPDAVLGNLPAPVTVDASWSSLEEALS